MAKDPWQHGHGKCGRLFCKECIDKNGEDKPCPNCRMEQPQYFEDNKSKYSLTSSYTVSFLLLTLCVCISVGKRDIRALPVKCDNVERGCQKEGTLGTLEEHMAVCQFTPVPCPKQCDDMVLLLRKDLDYHINNECPNRNYKCKHCGEKNTYIYIKWIHDRVCDEKIVPCPNEGCTETMKRHTIKDHVEDDCEYTEVPCKYANIGCEVKLKREDMRAHEEDDKIHLHLALGAVVELKDKNLQLQEASLKLRDTISQLRDTVGGLEYGLQLAHQKIKLSSREERHRKNKNLL